MGVVTARLVFLAFLGLTGTIIYNALYLQEHGPRGVASKPPSARVHQVATQTIASEPKDLPSELEVPVAPQPTLSEIDQVGTSSANLSAPAVSTDLPPLAPEMGESQLVVRAVQRELAARGYDVGHVDGQLSEMTRAAIAAFQRKEGLATTGLPSDDLLRQILLGDSVSPSAVTGSVAASDSITVNAAEYDTVIGVQRVLAELGYTPGPVDGAWGESTAGAISAFQRDRSIPATGQITPELIEELQRVTGRDFKRTAARP